MTHTSIEDCFDVIRFLPVTCFINLSVLNILLIINRFVVEYITRSSMFGKRENSKRQTKPTGSLAQVLSCNVFNLTFRLVTFF